MPHKRRSTRTVTAVKLAQLAVAAPQVVAIRTSRMLAAGANPGAADRAEFSRMHTEKTQAFWESMVGMSMQWWRLCLTPWWLNAPGGNRAAASLFAAALKPVHQKATANARRLMK
jgi:hypothetical protein